MMPVMTVMTVMDAHPVRDVGTGGVADGAPGDGTDWATDQRAGNAAHHGVSHAMLRTRNGRHERNDGSNQTCQQQFFHR
jgi:hypothetical protein